MTTRYSIGGRPETLARRPVDAPNGGPLPLPYSAYPGAADVARQGLQPLPSSLPPVDFARARPHRSVRYPTVVATELTTEQLLQAAWGNGRGPPSATSTAPRAIVSALPRLECLVVMTLLPSLSLRCASPVKSGAWLGASGEGPLSR